MWINFVSSADETMASYRYHNMIPARELNKLGHTATVTPYPEIEPCDAYVFSKHFNYGDWHYMKAMNFYDRKTVFHCCDNHFGTKHREHYWRMVKHASKVIATTQTLADIIKRETGVTATVIPDTYEFAEKVPSFKPDGAVNRPLNLLWYGHPSNLQDLIDALPQITPHNLRLCTAAIKPWPEKLGGLQVMPYSPKNILAALDWCDAVIIPSRRDERKDVKSANRLMEAVRRGKFVIASDLPAYQEFDSLMYIIPNGESLGVGLDWLQEQRPEDIEERIYDAQNYIKSFYSPERTGKLWEKVLMN